MPTLMDHQTQSSFRSFQVECIYIIGIHQGYKWHPIRWEKQSQKCSTRWHASKMLSSNGNHMGFIANGMNDKNHWYFFLQFTKIGPSKIFTWYVSNMPVCSHIYGCTSCNLCNAMYPRFRLNDCFYIEISILKSAIFKSHEPWL